MVEQKRKYIIGGNWKSNGTVDFVRKTCDALNALSFARDEIEVFICPISIHIASAKAMLVAGVEVASQNISVKKDGAFTGEISAEQVKDFGLRWTLIGHSERRTLYGETNDVVAAKVQRAQEAGLSAVVCIGETLEQREAGATNEVLKAQLDAVKGGINDWSRIVIAYEPVWAIGTGKVATPEIAQEAHAYIRSWLAAEVSAAVASATRIQYGGSATAANVGALIAQPDIDGFLVGGASLKPEFGDIIKISHAHYAGH